MNAVELLDLEETVGVQRGFQLPEKVIGIHPKKGNFIRKIFEVEVHEVNLWRSTLSYGRLDRGLDNESVSIQKHLCP